MDAFTPTSLPPSTHPLSSPSPSRFSSYSSSTKWYWSSARDWDRRWGGAQTPYTRINTWTNGICMYGSNEGPDKHCDLFMLKMCVSSCQQESTTKKIKHNAYINKHTGKENSVSKDGTSTTGQKHPSNQPLLEFIPAKETHLHISLPSRLT